MSQTIPATRQEVLKLKSRIAVTSRGKKLLEDKADAIKRELQAIAQEIEKMQEVFTTLYFNVVKHYGVAYATIDTDYLSLLENYDGMNIKVQSTPKKLVGITIPEFESEITGSPFVYGTLQTNKHLDTALSKVSELVPSIVKLIEKKRAFAILTEELTKTNRRVNALEYVVIPQLQSQMAIVKSKLEELSRSEKVGLMQAKTIIMSH